MKVMRLPLATCDLHPVPCDLQIFPVQRLLGLFNLVNPVPESPREVEELRKKGEVELFDIRKIGL
jgi:hypothetical protein